MGHRHYCGLILLHDHKKYCWERKILVELEKPTIVFSASDKLIIMGDFISDASSDAEMWRKVIRIHRIAD